MLARLLGIDGLTHSEWYLRQAWPRLVIFLVILFAIGYAAVLYRRQGAISRRRRVMLALFRATLYAALIVLLFEPVLGMETAVKLRRSVLVLLDTSESMGQRDVRKKRGEMEDAGLCLGKIPFDKRTYTLSAAARAEIAKASRLSLAKGLLEHPQLDLFHRLARDHKLRYFCFGDRLVPTSGEGESIAETLRQAQATGQATRLGSAIEESVSRHTGQPLAGVLVFSDGASNEGTEPLEVARRMKERGVPLYTVGFGVPDPPDLRIQNVIVQDTVFFKDKVPVRVQIASAGFTNRTVDVVVTVDGETAARQPVKLTGQPQFLELTFEPTTASGSLKLGVAVPPLPGESSAENNRTERTLRVIDEKIKVLYVEGKPRWEYRYLRAVLLRDHRLDVKFLMTQGDRDLAKASERYLAQFPEVASEAFVFDLIILGDVPATYFTPAQLARMEELVKERGGSLLVLAGHHHALASYLGTAIARMVPVQLQPEGWESIEDTVHPVVTEEGMESTVVSLDSPEEKNNARWAGVRPIFKVPALAGPKPGATVLATLSDAPRRRVPYPLIAWGRYGSGKSLFVGTDQLWRLRYKVGDKYHARFWGQAIQFLTLSRLLGQNKRIHLAASKKTYRTGDRVQIHANVLNENYEPITAADYTVYLERLDGPADVKAVRLERMQGVAGLYEGYVTPEEAGRYRLRTNPAQSELSNTVELGVVSLPLEKLEPAMQEETLRKMAELSGGRYLRIRDLPSLPDIIAREHLTTAKRTEKELWNLPGVFLALLACAGLEWFLRRRYDLI